MPLGNFTSQFFANVYLNELDYFVKHTLKAKYYIRYVDDFVILHKSKKRLAYFQKEIVEFLKTIKLELHPEKSTIIPLQKGITFLGYRIFYHYTLLRKRNKRYFIREFSETLTLVKNGWLNSEGLIDTLKGWLGYARWADTYNFRCEIIESLKTSGIKISEKNFKELDKLKNKCP